MRVLVTGNLGYLGTVLSRVFTDAGHEVVGLDTGFFAECILGEPPVDAPTIKKDIRDVTPEDLDGFDAVVHLAALSNDPLGHLAPQITYDINLHASVNLAKAAKTAGVPRFLYASTCSVYGSAGSGLVGEDAPLRPLTPYAESKVQVEYELDQMADDSFSPAYLRNATAFGFSPRLRADIVLNNLVGHAILSGEILVLSDGTPWRPLVHANDIAAAFLATAEAPREDVHAVALNIGDESNNVTVAEIANAVAEEIPEAKVVITGETGADPRSYRVDFSRARDVIPAFVPQWSVRRGAAELRDAYRSAGLNQSGFEQSFVRLRQLEKLQRQGALDSEFRWL